MYTYIGCQKIIHFERESLNTSGFFFTFQNGSKNIEKM